MIVVAWIAFPKRGRGSSRHAGRETAKFGPEMAGSPGKIEFFASSHGRLPNDVSRYSVMLSLKSRRPV